MEKQKFNEPEIKVTPITETDIIRTSGGEGMPLPDEWWN